MDRQTIGYSVPSTHFLNIAQPIGETGEFVERDRRRHSGLTSYGGLRESSTSQASPGPLQRPHSRRYPGSSSPRQHLHHHQQSRMTGVYADRPVARQVNRESWHATTAIPDFGRREIQPSRLLDQDFRMADSMDRRPKGFKSSPVEADDLSELTFHDEDDDSVGLESDVNYDSDDSTASTTTTVDDSVVDFFFENGRRYHRFREGLYLLPNDDLEIEREELLHELIKLLNGGRLHHAPIESHPQNILDIGTGTGAWAVDVADRYPSANVLGVDLSPIQPQWTPSNATFIIDDVESSWPYQRDTFDMVHCRQAAFAIRDWPRLCRQSFTHLKPGGWIELQDFQYQPQSAARGAALSPTHPIATYWNLIRAALSTVGVDLDNSNGMRLVDELRRAGFQHVSHKVIHVPIGAWPNDGAQSALGRSFREAFVSGLQANALAPLCRCLRWDRSRVELLLMEVRRAYQDDSQMIYYPYHIVTGQKPSW